MTGSHRVADLDPTLSPMVEGVCLSVGSLSDPTSQLVDAVAEARGHDRWRSDNGRTATTIPPPTTPPTAARPEVIPAAERPLTAPIVLIAPMPAAVPAAAPATDAFRPALLATRSASGRCAPSAKATCMTAALANPGKAPSVATPATAPPPTTAPTVASPDISRRRSTPRLCRLHLPRRYFPRRQRRSRCQTAGCQSGIDLRARMTVRDAPGREVLAVAAE